MTAQIEERLSWGGSRGSEGLRTYKITHLVRSDYADGPYVVMNTPGLPIVGSVWNYGNDLDPWVVCHPNREVKIHKEKKGEPNMYWAVTDTFSNRPIEMVSQEAIEDPLLEPPKVSGSFVKYTKQVGWGYYTTAQAAAGGPRLEPMSTYSNEAIRGAEFDHNRPTVRIEQNIATLGLAASSQMVDTVNSAALWGLAARRIKLSGVSWQQKVYGDLNVYYTRILDFDINFESFDSEELSFGSMALGRIEGEDGVWVTAGYDPDDPGDFHRYKDKLGEPARTFHDVFGKPVGRADAAKVNVIYYRESNFLLLGIPVIF